MDLVTFTEEILNEKRHFCAVIQLNPFMCNIEKWPCFENLAVKRPQEF